MNMKTKQQQKKPNATTRAAIKEARSGKELETLDLDNFQNYVASL